MRVLIVEDDIELSAAIAEYLELQGAICDFAYNGKAAVELAAANQFDVIVLDLMLPKLNGFDVCSKLRQQGKLTPILMLTAMGTNEDQLNGFAVGVDDYVVKPTPMPIIWARLQALFKRSQNQIAHRVLGPLKINLASRKLERDGKPIELTATEWKLFELLLMKSPSVVSRNEIHEHIWPDQEHDSGLLNVHLHGLRKSLDKPFAYPLIKTRVGMGIELSDED